MGKVTAVQWAKSSIGFWTGCTKISDGCLNCYAERFHRWVSGGRNWGTGAPRIEHMATAAKALLAWNKEAALTEKFWPVFVNPEADIFDNEVPQAWRDFAFAVMKECRHLTFICVSKRIGNGVRMLPKDWGPGYPNVWLLATIVNMQEALRDLPLLLRLRAVVHGVSYEPALGRVDWDEALNRVEALWQETGSARLDWIIVGGESGTKARPCRLTWIESTVQQCRSLGIPCFVKQLGAVLQIPERANYVPIHTGRNAKGDPKDWPLHLRVREYPQ